MALAATKAATAAARPHLQRGENAATASSYQRRARPLRAGGVPADHRVGNRVGRGEIGLDVEQRGLVEAIEAHDRKPRPLDPRAATGSSNKAPLGGCRSRPR